MISHPPPSPKRKAITMDSPAPPISSSSKPSDQSNTNKDDPTTATEKKSIPIFVLAPSSPSPPSKRKSTVDDQPAAARPRRKPKNRTSSSSSSTAAPLRNLRKPRKRPEKQLIIEEDGADDEIRALVPVEEEEDAGRPRKRRQRKQPKVSEEEDGNLRLVASLPSSASTSTSTPISVAGGNDGFWSGDELCGLISELVLWEDVAKSTLWFGSGSIFFLSSCFSRASNFSIISAASHVGILILGMAFFNDCLRQRQQHKKREMKFHLTEEDFLRVARVILPVANAVLAKSQQIFSGDPSMTLKVAPVLLLTAKYGHLITPWRLLTTGFFLSFTLPKLYSSYSEKIHHLANEVKSSVKQAWKSCPHKKLVATSTTMAVWNLLGVKTRIFAAFMSLVVFRHHHRQRMGGVNGEIECMETQRQQVTMED